MINFLLPIQIALLRLFFGAPDRRCYLREIQRLLKIPVASLQRHLDLLEKEKIIESEKVGPLKYFFLNKNYSYFEEVGKMVLKEERFQKLKKNLQKAMKILKEKYKPEKIILFGSMGQEHIQPNSDLDLFIVKEKVPARYWDRVKELAPLFGDCDVGIDFVVWTPQELADEKDKNLFLKEEILRKGKVIYERAA